MNNAEIHFSVQFRFCKKINFLWEVFEHMGEKYISRVVWLWQISILWKSQVMIFSWKKPFFFFCEYCDGIVHYSLYSSRIEQDASFRFKLTYSIRIEGPYTLHYHWGGFIDLVLYNVLCIFLCTLLIIRQPNGLAYLHMRTFWHGKADWLRFISQLSLKSEMKHSIFHLTLNIETLE